jgi:ATP-binding cassette subfamily B protein
VTELDAAAPSLRARLRLRRRERGGGSEESHGPWHFLRDFPHILPYVRRYWPLAIVSLAMVGTGAVTGLISPWPLAILLDTVLGNKPVPSLLGFLGGMGRYQLLILAVVAGLVVTIVEQGLTIVDEYVNTKLHQRLVLDFRSDLFRHAQKLSLAFHDQTATGALMYRIHNQADSLGAITGVISPLLQALVTLVGMFVIAYKIDSELALISLTVVPLIYYSASYYTKRIEPRLHEVRELESGSLSIVYEAMSMLRVIVAFGREGHEYRRFREQSETAIDARVRLTVRQTFFSLAVSTITAAGSALVLGFGAYHVLKKDLTIGELMVVIGYIAAIYQPLEQISGTISTLQQSFIGFSSALKLLAIEPEVKEAPDAVDIGRAEGSVVFDGVAFAYGGRDSTLEDISFRVEPGKRVAIVGPTGAGKTTLMSLVMRFHDPGSGAITLDGVDLKQLKLACLREQISVVLQEPLLFSGTIRENIRYGKLDATDDEIDEAAKAANAHEFITQLPDGYDTSIGERGSQLSGGERQRVCVARAFLKDAPILVLDEPTSSIDSKTEAVILDALDRLMDGRTTFMIAHRLSTIRRSDMILVIDHGRLVESGTHEDLLRRRGLYKQLYDMQTRQVGRRLLEDMEAVLGDGQEVPA